MGRTLTSQDSSTVASAVNGEVVYSAVVRLYTASGSSWEKVCVGGAALVSNGSSYSLQVVDLDTASVAFNQELYQQFEYAKPKPFFHTFEGDESVVGFSFADEGEATEFYNKVVDNLPVGSSPRASTLRPPPVPNKPATPPATPVAPAQPQPAASQPAAAASTPAPASTPAANSPSKKGTISGKKKKGFFGALLGGSDDSEELVISEPSNFRHVSNIGWNPSEGSFEIRNIPPEWKKLFQGIGIKKSELKNPETAKYIMSVIEENGGVPPESGGPPPPPGGGPPPPPGGRQPPPPPGGRQVPPPPGSGGPPPPPGGGPPPPPSGGPPPPGADAPPPPSGGPPPSGTLSRSGGGFLSELQNAKLNKVDSNSARPDSIPPPPTGLAGTLARAMEERRKNIKEDVQDEEEDEDWDEDWDE